MRLNLSPKKVKPLNELVGDKKFLFPKEMATDINPENDKLSLKVTINGSPTWITVGEDTEIPYQVYCTLRDVGIIRSEFGYEIGGNFDPFH